ncbi:2Fe-2S ferredoxin-type domain-containing protein [Dunaliella salina]|uniref:Ferredoxin n=1 Tax=Dunaliella salina TaxID=3046 RepID=A0ABQ7GT29_DUNSA|nr:2Fe-2S ferredoxin-type domain-containing protein [Dunaliella salina]|eukprot:KAF5837755.1 2Fe-2S ferredoxin-type domain-containing protein [Dunaliella salina]
MAFAAGFPRSLSYNMTSPHSRRPASTCGTRPVRNITVHATKEGGAQKQESRRKEQKEGGKSSSETASPLDLGPIGMTFSSQGGDSKDSSSKKAETAGLLDLGPIGMTFSGGASTSGTQDAEASQQQRLQSISKMTTEEWRAKYEKDGTVDLWLEEEFNAGSRLIGGRDAHYGNLAGFGTGEGKSAGNVPSHKVKIHNHFAQQEMEVDVPEDRYILWEAEDHGLQLPYACRMGCCTACAVRVKSGTMYQPEAVGISMELKEQGYGLMCVGYPLTDVELETVSEDEVYDLQFGQSFEKQALNPELGSIERDDYAIEIANMDE